MTFSVFAVLYKIYSIESDNGSISFGSIFFVLLSVAGGLQILVQTYMFYIKQDAFLEAFNAINFVDKKFKKFNIYFSFRWFNFFNFCATFCFLLSLFVHDAIVQMVTGRTFLKQFPITLAYLGAFILRQTSLYYVFAFSVTTYGRHMKLNKLIEYWNNEDFNGNVMKGRLKIVAHILIKTCDASEYIAEAFPFAELGNLTMTSISMMLFIFSFFGINEERRGEILFMVLGDCTTTWGLLMFLEYFMYEVIVSSIHISTKE